MLTYTVKGIPDFKNTLLRLSMATGKELPQLINKKLFYIARRSVWYTHVADAGRIATTLGQVMRVVKKGKRTGALTMVTAKKDKRYFSNTDVGAPLAALLINKWRGERGKKGLYGDAMRDDFRKFVGAKMRSIGFLKAGWIVARDRMQRLSKINVGPLGTVAGGGKRSGIAKLGGAKIAKKSAHPVGIIWNQAAYSPGSKDKWSGKKLRHNKALMKYALPAVERAFAEEKRDIKQQLINVLRKQANILGIKTR